MNESQTELFTISEVAKILKVSKPTVYRLFKDGQLEWCAIGHHRRVSQKQLDEYIKKSATGD